MIKRHPVFILLVLLLGLAVLASSLTACCAPKVTVSLCDADEENLGEAMEDLPEEQEDRAEDVIDHILALMEAAASADAPERLTGTGKPVLSYCSFGWVLPLRI